LGDEEMVQNFLIKGANPNCRKQGGITPLMAAAFSGNSSAMAKLIEYGADIYSKHPSGVPMLEFALLSEKQQAVDLLLERCGNQDALLKYTLPQKKVP
jgi:ankyrin repeat protein